MRLEAIQTYLSDITNANNEEAKKLLFFSLLNQLYIDNDEAKQIIKQMQKGAEKNVYNIPLKNRLKTGRADTQYGKIIIEFEHDLKKSKAHAEEQLKEYLTGNWNSGNLYNYTLISTDGLEWNIYGADPESYISKTDFAPANLKLKPIASFRLDKSNSEDFFIFIDRFIFRIELLEPTLENIQTEFGGISLLFAEVFNAMKKHYNDVKDQPEISTAYNEWLSFLSIAYGSFDGSADVFIIHSYLSVFSKLLAYSVITHKQVVEKNEILEIINGKVFTRYQVDNFVEQDFYGWVSNTQHFESLHRYFEMIVEKLGRYDFSDVRADILKGVYQELIDIETRQALGEYYTPDWLCESVVNNFKFEKNSNILDPSCGSGSFLMAVLTKLKTDFPDITIEELSGQVVGIDIHPLSVQIAKATLLIGMQNLIRKARKPVILRVYLANSIVTPEGTKDLFGEDYAVSFNKHRYNLPIKIFDFPELFDRAIIVCDKLADMSMGKTDEKPGTITQAIRNYHKDVPVNLINNFYEIYKGFKIAKEQGKDSIWRFILQNSYKPFFLKNRFDFVIGNPPWFTYSSIINADYQQQLYSLAQKYDLLPVKKANMPHLEIAAIFMSHSASYFLKDNGRLAFVLPRSFINADQHDNTRNGKAKGFNIYEIWDMEQIKPLFNIPSCVIFSSKSDKPQPISIEGIPGVNLKGRLPAHNATLNEVKDKISINSCKWFYSKLGDSSAFTNSQVNYSNDSNVYREHFYNGATIFPRNFFFISLINDKPEDWNDRIIQVKSDDANDKDAKKPWKDIKLKGSINTNYLFRTALAKNIVPFGLIKPPFIVLPVKVKNDEVSQISDISLLTSSQIKEAGDLETYQWFDECEHHWNKNKTEHGKEMGFLDRLNFQKGITSQNLNKQFIVIYSASGKDANSTVIDRKDFDLPFVGENIAYLCFLDNKEEAYYIASFLNSNYANLIIKDFQAKGLFGARHVHTKILDVPFSRYDENNKNHRRIAEIGLACNQKVQQHIKLNNLETEEYNVGKLRLEIRSLLAGELREIDGLLIL